MLGWKDLSNYDFYVVTLLESIQIEWMLRYKDTQALGVLLHHYPKVSWVLKQKAPQLKTTLEELEQTHQELPENTTLRALEQAFIQSLEDWVIYVTDPNIYDQLSFNQWDDDELLSLTDFTNKTVIDVGSGTGSQLFRMAPKAKYVYAVEPIGHLRRFIKAKATEKGYDNIYITDGLLTEIPFHDSFADITVTGHVFGDAKEEELNELTRVTKPGGMIILMPGNNDEDNDTHQFLIENGFAYGRFLEPGPSPSHGYKRKYWKTI